MSSGVVWEGSKTKIGDTPASMVAARLQGLHLGLVAAQQLGFKDINILAPSDHQVLQVCLPLHTSPGRVQAQA